MIGCYPFLTTENCSSKARLFGTSANVLAEEFGNLLAITHALLFQRRKMNKPVYRFLSFMAAFALTFGGHTGVLASSPSESALQISNTYYVSTNGSDSNTGTQAAPFKTFAKA